MVKKYVDINGVRYIFEVMEEKLNLTRDELLEEIKKNTASNSYTKEEIDSKVDDLHDEINENAKALEEKLSGYVKASDYITDDEIEGISTMFNK